MTSLLEFRVDGRFYLAFDVHENNLLGIKGPSHTDFKIGKYWELLSQMLPIIILSGSFDAVREWYRFPYQHLYAGSKLLLCSAGLKPVQRRADAGPIAEALDTLEWTRQQAWCEARGHLQDAYRPLRTRHQAPRRDRASSVGATTKPSGRFSRASRKRPSTPCLHLSQPCPRRKKETLYHFDKARKTAPKPTDWRSYVNMPKMRQRLEWKHQVLPRVRRARN